LSAGIDASQRAARLAAAALASLALGALLVSGCGRDPEGSARPADAREPQGKASSAEQGSAPWFEEVAQARGLAFEHVSGHAPGRYRMPEIMSGGAALFDLGADGDLDAYLVQGGALEAGERELRNQLFENTGSAQFRDISAGSGADVPGYGNGVACGDVDGDGLVDLYVTRWGPNELLRQMPDARFEPRGAAAGVAHASWGTSAGFFDCDRDGALDLYVCNYLEWTPAGELPCKNNAGAPDYCSPRNYETPAADALYRNRGDGTFEDLSRGHGIAAEPATGLGLVCADFDGDGWQDVFVANDGMPNLLWKNLAGQRMQNVARERGCAVDESGLAKAGMGVVAADYDGDLDLDLFVSNLNRETDSLYRNEGAWFRDRTALAGLALASKPLTRFGTGWLDFDNDGWLDLHQANGRVMRLSPALADDPYAEPNLLMRGLPDGRFEEVLPRGDLALARGDMALARGGTASALVATSRASAYGDLDGDGGLDVLVVNRDGAAHLLRNAHPARGAWLLLDVRERGGRPALGATVHAKLGARTLRREVQAASSYQASSDPRVHVGLGAAERLSEVRVRYVDGHEQSFGELGAGAVHVLQRAD
jgi:hypothetical protein